MHPSERKPDRLFGRCECSSLRDDAGCVCNLYSITTNQAAIIALFRVINRYVGALLPVVCDTLFLDGLLYLGDSLSAPQRYAPPFGSERLPVIKKAPAWGYTLRPLGGFLCCFCRVPV